MAKNWWEDAPVADDDSWWASAPVAENQAAPAAEPAPSFGVSDPMGTGFGEEIMAAAQPAAATAPVKKPVIAPAAPAPYRDRREALDEAVNLLEEGVPKERVSAAFSKAGIGFDEISAYGAKRGSSYFQQQAPMTPAEVERARAAPALSGSIKSLRSDEPTFGSDIALAAGRGVVGGFGMLANAFGVSGDNAPKGGIRTAAAALKQADAYLEGLRSAAAVKDDEAVAEIMEKAKDGTFLEQVAAAGKAASVSPAQLIAQGLGSTVPTLLAAIIPGVRESVVASLVAGAGTGAAMGAGSIKSSIFNTVREDMINSGMSPQEADERATAAQSYLGQNKDQIAIGMALGALASSTGVERIVPLKSITNVLSRSGVSSAVAGAQKTALGRAAIGAVAEAAPEALQGGQEQVAQNVALQREGRDIPTFQGAVGQGALEGLAGAGAGGLIGGLIGRPAPQTQSTSPDSISFTAPDSPAAAAGLPPIVVPNTGAANVSIPGATGATLPGSGLAGGNQPGGGLGNAGLRADGNRVVADSSGVPVAGGGQAEPGRAGAGEQSAGVVDTTIPAAVGLPAITAPTKLRDSVTERATDADLIGRLAQDAGIRKQAETPQPVEIRMARGGRAYDSADSAAQALPAVVGSNADLFWRIEPTEDGKYRIAGYEQPARSESQVDQPVTSWTGGKGAGYETADAAARVLPMRQRESKGKIEWRVEQRPDGRFQLNGYKPTTSGGENVAAGSGTEGQLPGVDRQPAGDAAGAGQNVAGQIQAGAAGGQPANAAAAGLAGADALQRAGNVAGGAVAAEVQGATAGEAGGRGLAPVAGNRNAGVPAGDGAVDANAGGRGVVADGGQVQQPAGAAGTAQERRAGADEGVGSPINAAALESGVDDGSVEADIRAIQDARLKSSGGREVVKLQTVKPGLSEAADLAMQMASAAQAPIIFIADKNGKARFNGVAIKKRIYINVSSKNPLTSVAAHEIVHTMPDDIKVEMISAVMATVSPEKKARFLRDFSGYADKNVDKQNEELASILTEEDSKNPEFWQSLADKMGDTEFGKLARHILSALSRLTAGFTGSRADRYTDDIKAVREAVTTAYAKTLERQGMTAEEARVEVQASEQPLKRGQIQLGDFVAKPAKDGSITVLGSPEEIRAAIPEDVQGRAVEGGVQFTSSDAPRVRGALEGRKLAYSRAGQVVDKLPMKNGKYLGAPPDYDTPAKITGLRKMLMKLTLEGERGRFWYENSSKAVLKMAGSVQEARRFVALLAIYSPQAKVDTNTTFALRAWAQYRAGQPINVKTRVMDQKATDAMRDIDAFWSGEKTGNFFNNLLREIDPSTAVQQGATIDMWMMRAGMYPTDAPTKTQYAFMENETNRIAAELGWEPQQVQAAIWVAMKARMENKGVKKRTESISEKKGWIRFSPNAKGQSVRVIIDAQKHRDNWLKQAMGHTPTDADTQAAKFDFEDGLMRHIGQVSFEARPGRSTGVLPGIHDAPYAQQVEFQQAVQRALLDERGVDMLASAVGLLVDSDILAPGVWQGDVSPSTQMSVAMAPNSGQVAKNEVDPAQASALNVYSSVLGLLTKQEGVGWHRPFYATTKREANGVDISIGRAINPAEAVDLENAIDGFMTSSGKSDWRDGFAVVSSASGVRLLNFGAITNDILQSDLMKAIEPALPDFEYRLFASSGDMPTNNWKESPNGQGYIQRIRSEGRSDVLDWARSVLAPRVQSVFNEFAEANGWGDPGTIDFSEQPAARDERGRLDGIEAIHYSKASRQSLSSSSFGTGLQGSAREEYLGAEDQRRRQRISFYVDKGTGIRPEAGVGGYAHKATLDNIYDANSDPQNLRKGGQAAFETAVLDAGFDGYLDRMMGTQPGQVILLGKRTVSVQPIGPKTVINDAKKVPAAAVKAEGSRVEGEELVRKPNDTQMIEVIRARPALGQAAPSFRMEYGFARVKQSEAPAADKVLADAGSSFQFGSPQFSEQTDTPAFKAWFGDSKVVDAEGRPLVVYHGTQKDIDEFKSRHRGWAANNVWGHFFTRSASNASDYALGDGQRVTGANVLPAYLSLQNPYVMPWQEWQHFNSHLHREDASALKKRLLKEGFDGIIDNAGMEFVAFKAGQIKSATGNRGTFDPANPDIRFSEIGDAMQSRIDSDFEGVLAEYATLKGADGGRKLDADIAREMSPEYRQDRSRAPEVHEAVSDFVQRAFDRRMAEAQPGGIVAFMAGGGGAGKSSAEKLLAPVLSQAGTILDGTFSNLEKARANVQKAFDAGQSVAIAYVYREPVEAVRNGVLPRAMRTGRTVPADVLAKAHAGSLETVRALQAEFGSRPDFMIRVIDNSLGPNKAEKSSLENITPVILKGLKERIQNATQEEFDAGRIDEKTYRAVYGNDAPGKTEGASSVQEVPGGIRQGPGREAEAGGPGDAVNFSEQTDTPAFKRWFGDSKVVDAEGKPLVVYHGTSAEFDRFRTEGGFSGVLGEGSYFTSKPNEASNYAGRQEGARVLPVYVSVQRPYMAGGPMTPDGAARIRESGNYDGIIAQSGDSMVVVPFSPNQIKSATGNRGTFDPANPDIRFSNQPGYNVPAESRGEAFRRKVQDQFLRVRQVQDAIREQGGTVGEAQDVYRAEERMYGRVQNQIDDFKNNVIEPMVKKAQKAGITLDELSLYAYAIHAPEYNAAVARKDKTFTDGGSGMTNQEAADILAAFEKEGKTKALDELQKELVNITSVTNRVRLDEGLITQDQFDRMESAYSNYVPLRGFANAGDEKVENIPNVTSGRGFNIRGNEVMSALGRSTRAGDIIENVVRDYERAIVRSERNNVAKTFLDLVMTNPDPALWEIDSVKTVRSLSDETGMVERNQLIDKGADTVSVKVAGKQIYIKVNDQLLLRALQQTAKEETQQVNALLFDTIGWYNNLLRNGLTVYNPAFAAVNTARDFQAAMFAVGTDLGPEGVRLFARYYGQAWAASVRNERNALDPDARQTDKYFQEFKAAGSTTGGFYMRDEEEVSRELRTMLLQAGASPNGIGETIRASGPAKAAGKVFRVLQFLGSSSENATRFAAYRAAREMGKTPGQAASIAKNLTTNFNRKGEWGQTLNTLYLFFNAGVQGIQNLARVAKNKKAQGALAGLAGLAAGLAFYGAGAGGDDEDGVAYWDKIPDFEKQRNLIIMLPPSDDIVGGTRVGSKGRYLKIPAPYGFNFFTSMGYTLADMGRHAVDRNRGIGPMKGALNMVSAVGQSFNPFGGGFDLTNQAEVLLAMSPTIGDLPIQLALGVNGFGRSVGPSKSAFDTKPDSETFNVSQAGSFSQKLARGLNTATGGNQARAGVIDIMPGTIENIGRNIFGSAGDFVYQTLLNVPTKLLSPEGETTYRDIPVAKAFYGQADTVTDTGIAYERRKKVLDEAATQEQERKLGITREYTEEERAMRDAGPAAKRFTTAMSRLRREELAIVDSSELTKQQKLKEQIRLKQERAAIVREFNSEFMAGKKAQKP